MDNQLEGKEKMKRKKSDRSKIQSIKPYIHGAEGSDGANVDGESTWIYLRRFDVDRSLHGRLWNTCCTCGSEHLYVYQVVHEPQRDYWWLVKRAYQNPSKIGTLKDVQKRLKKEGKKK